MSEFISYADDFRAFDDLLCKMRRNENDALFLSEDYVARHYRRASDAYRRVDSHEHDISNGRRIPSAVEYREIGDLLDTLDVAGSTVNYQANATAFGPNRISQVVPHERAIYHLPH